MPDPNVFPGSSEVPLEETIVPRVIVDQKASPEWEANATQLAQLLTDKYSMSENGIANTTVIVDGDNRLSYKGSHTSKLLYRLLHGKSPENDGAGSVIRVGTRFRGRRRTQEEVNETLAHELEHAAQQDRKDPKVVLGNLATWGVAATGAVVGNKLTRNSSPAIKFVASSIGAIIGQSIGYRFASHESEARRKAQRVQVSIIKRRR